MGRSLWISTQSGRFHEDPLENASCGGELADVILVMKKLLVIGAGYLGEEILKISMSHGWEAVGATLSGGDGFLSCDVGNKSSVADLPDADAVVHCASSGRGGADAYRYVYVEGCRNLAWKFPNARLAYTSSSSVYGQVNGAVVDEESDTSPDRDTGRLLLEAESVIRQAGGIVIRLAGIYGPDRSALLRKFLIGDAVIEETGDRFINQIHRNDAATAVLHLLDSKKFAGGEIFNAADSVTHTQKEVYAGLAEIFGKDLPPSGPRDLNRKRGWTNKVVSNTKLRAMGWEPSYPDFLKAVDRNGSVLG